MNTNLDILDDEIAGGPAHPCPEVRTHDTGDIVQNADQGVTKRDWFAANLTGVLSVRTARALMGDVPAPTANALEEITWWAEAEARHRYIKADAMMKVRTQ
jgi:hypothetical protein